MTGDHCQSVEDVRRIGQPGTAPEPDDAFISGSDAPGRALRLDKDISFHANIRILFYQIHFQTFLCAVEENNGQAVRRFHAERDWNDIRVFLSPHADADRIAS